MPHENPPDGELGEILQSTKVIAVVGASADPDKAGNSIPAYLQEHGYRIVPVNPGGGEILGEEAVASLADVEGDIDVVNVFRPSEETPEIAEQAVTSGARVLWLQKGVANEQAAEIAREGGLTVVMDDCMMQVHRRTGLSG